MCLLCMLFFAFLQLQAGGIAQAQGESDGEDVDDGELQQAGHHGGVEFGVFLRGDAQYAVGKLCQRGVVAGQGG